jgi:hypothetical protein
MKKKLILLAGSLLAIAAVATTVVTTNSNEDMSLLARNIEALARGESGGCDCDGNPEWECYLILSDGSKLICGDGFWY